MNRLQSELDRLYQDADGGTPDRVRALVLEVVQPAGWAALSKAWQGVQADLGLPAPAIAVSGVDGLQLWFSLETPIPSPRAHAFLESLRARFLADVAPARVRLTPDPAAPARRAPIVPALQEPTGNWSAFVAPDLAALFSDAPWLDVEPGEEGQAALLRGLQTTKQPSFEAAVARLAADSRPAQVPPRPAAAETCTDPKRFLRQVMNDESVALALRIEAAKALLPYAGD
jgi:hypothetical protein